jgi:hypothetical protein
LTPAAPRCRRRCSSGVRRRRVPRPGAFLLRPTLTLLLRLSLCAVDVSVETSTVLSSGRVPPLGISTPRRTHKNAPPGWNPGSREPRAPPVAPPLPNPSHESARSLARLRRAGLARELCYVRVLLVRARSAEPGFEAERLHQSAPSGWEVETLL